MQKGQRKIYMMQFSYYWIGGFGLAYLLVCVYLKQMPTDGAIGSAFLALGAITSMGKWANGQEHKYSNENQDES